MPNAVLGGLLSLGDLSAEQRAALPRVHCTGHCREHCAHCPLFMRTANSPVRKTCSIHYTDNYPVSCAIFGAVDPATPVTDPAVRLSMGICPHGCRIEGGNGKPLSFDEAKNLLGVPADAT